MAEISFPARFVGCNAAKTGNCFYVHFSTPKETHPQMESNLEQVKIEGRASADVIEGLAINTDVIVKAKMVCQAVQREGSKFASTFLKLFIVSITPVLKK